MNSRLFSWLRSALPLLLATPGFAHPMGNFSINHYTRISVQRGAVELRYVLDLAEIPTYQEMQRTGMTAEQGSTASAHYLAQQAETLRRGLRLRADGRALGLTMASQQILFSPGAGGLPTMKMGFTYRATLPGGAGTRNLKYEDGNFRERAGWKELVCDASGLLSSSGCGPERSRELTDYPTDLLNSPPQDTEASLLVALSPIQVSRSAAVRVAVPLVAVSDNKPSAASAAEIAQPKAGPELTQNRQSTPRNAFTELIATPASGLWFFVFAALVAAGLGALHALEPGHGKTMVAAYLVGSRGTPTHAVLLGLIVTAVHTAGVYALGAVTLYASHYFFPEQIYPWLGLISGLAIAGLGIFLFLQRWSGQSFEHDDSDPSAPHSHWFTRPPAARASSSQNPTGEKISLKQLMLMGITGGMIPCPAALVVLLSAVSLRRTGFGLFLIVAFSVGLAVVLISVGLAMVGAQRVAVRWGRWRGDSPLLQRWLPMTSAACIALLGSVIAFRAFAGSHLAQGQFPAGGWGALLLTVGLGLVLGIRHSTDPDHVVAVSTIVSRQRSVGQGAMIGAVWGIGHTLTIFAVGSAIILFRIAIPARMGLAMEFLVALMLIVLGVLNLTGLLPRVRGWLAAKGNNPASNKNAGAPGEGVKPITANSRWYGLMRPLTVGVVHGLAGSAAVALLVLSTIRTPGWAICYLLVFGVGTIAGMMMMTAAISLPFAFQRFDRAGNYLSVGSGIVSLAFGSFLVYQLAYLGGLFTAHPVWTPR